MQVKFVSLVVAAVLSSAAHGQNPSKPQDGEPTVMGGMESTPNSKARIDARRKTVAKINPVDINNASEKQLKKLPGIGDAEAKRIIANRPYGSKLWLVTNGVIGEGPYANVKHLIVAKQPFKTAEENAALYEKLQ
jgi:competence protein ComEA